MNHKTEDKLIIGVHLLLIAAYIAGGIYLALGGKL